MHNIHDSVENYLEAIVVLERSLGMVRSVDLANHLNISRASVSNAIKKMEADGQVTMGEGGALLLSEEGRRIGREIDERHQTVKGLLIHIGVSEENAENDACRIEHAISAETFDRIKELLKKAGKEK
ncbi:MAG: metal-dependent transcriptional regulator [Peptoniphilaceae bacterium]|nr:metal-dependent transcriptional regulator [Peptoniphilaceae bacterium]MDD7433509.1 metal-dependent transcriptional regulator [Peptoniphilaceae bacterium]MDY3075722.1 metal-dependent transcriptional regulator [Peptoniphilaceae bacterium]MDY3987633.1 metal-dependent transcriptional regulator [Peptoniphilaceae bacterium]MDY4196220.1 metal-dependent transcriptional regulator [Peptoniphilaceae bacterium]